MDSGLIQNKWNGMEYPSLSYCARRLLVIPASSAECERHFGAHLDATSLFRNCGGSVDSIGRMDI